MVNSVDECKNIASSPRRLLGSAGAGRRKQPDTIQSRRLIWSQNRQGCANHGPPPFQTSTYSFSCSDTANGLPSLPQGCIDCSTLYIYMHLDRPSVPSITRLLHRFVALKSTYQPSESPHLCLPTSENMRIAPCRMRASQWRSRPESAGALEQGQV